MAQVAQGEYSPRSPKTVKDIATEWYRQRAAQPYRRATLISWRNHVDNYVVPSLGYMKVMDLDVHRVEAALEEWAKDIAPVSANKVLTTLTAILDMAERHGQVRRNVAEKALRVKVKTEEDGAEVELDQVYTKAELSRLINSTDGMTKVFVMIMSLTGVRSGECFGLVWPNIDLKAAKLDVRLSLTDQDRGKESTLEPVKTRSSKRTIPLPHELVKELTAWKLRSPINDKDLVFARTDGKPYRRSSVRTLLDKAITKAGIKRLTPHGLRHTFASLLLADGRPVPEVSHLLGHRNAQVTMSIYAHFIPKETTAVQDLATSIMGE